MPDAAKQEDVQNEKDYVIAEVKDNFVNKLVFVIRSNDRNALNMPQTGKDLMAKARKDYGFAYPAEEYQFTGGIDTLDDRYKHRFQKEVVITDRP